MRSPIYWHPKIYQLCMRLLYGKGYSERYNILAQEIGDLTVLDVCCGDCMLSTYLAPRRKYSGIDVNPYFVHAAQKKGLAVQRMDIRKIALPKSECIVMQGSLYHFFPHPEQILRKMLKSATKKVIISEPVQNISASQNKILRGLAQGLSNAGTGPVGKRFSKESLITLFNQFNAQKIIIQEKEVIGIFQPCQKHL